VKEYFELLESKGVGFRVAQNLGFLGHEGRWKRGCLRSRLIQGSRFSFSSSPYLCRLTFQFCGRKFILRETVVREFVKFIAKYLQITRPLPDSVPHWKIKRTALITRKVSRTLFTVRKCFPSSTSICLAPIYSTSTWKPATNFTFPIPPSVSSTPTIFIFSPNSATKSSPSARSKGFSLPQHFQHPARRRRSLERQFLREFAVSMYFESATTRTHQASTAKKRLFTRSESGCWNGSKQTSVNPRIVLVFPTATLSQNVGNAVSWSSTRLILLIPRRRMQLWKLYRKL
jgi:hypothetical protein